MALQQVRFLRRSQGKEGEDEHDEGGDEGKEDNDEDRDEGQGPGGPEWVLARGRDQGVHFGILVNDGSFSGWVVLDECRRIWSWEGATELSELSVYGIKDGRVSVTVRPKRLRYSDVCEILPLSDAALKNLQSFEEWRARP